MSIFENQYTIIEKIGEGGMGTVYVANDTMLDRKVAIKQLNRSSVEDASMSDRFQQEALALARLNHPNITHLYSFIPKENTYWMVMEYVEGKTLEDWIRIHTTIGYQLVATIAAQMLDGIGHAHKKGIIHRDMKPANVMINEDGEVKIMDFGIARMRNAQRLTSHGKSVGTLEYMSPEQIQGKEGDERTDIYAVGNIMYELLSGNPPYQANSDYQIMKDKLEQNPRPISSINPSVPSTLQKIISKALERNPDNRYQSAQEFKRAIETAFGANLLPTSSLLAAIEAPQITTNASTTATTSTVNSLLSKAKNISGDIHIPDIKKVSKPVLLLIGSVILCLILLVWALMTPNPDTPSPDTAVANPIENSATTTEGFVSNDASPTTGAVSETPNEMYQRISKQNNANNNTESETPKEEKTEAPKPTPKKVEPRKEEQKKEYPKEEEKVETEPARPVEVRKSNTGPVEVPAGKTIRVTLSETISSENPDRDGAAIRLTCSENVEAGGRVIIRKGATVTGKIVDVIPSNNGRKKALIGFTINKVQAVDGSEIKLRSARFRLFASEPGKPVSYNSGQSFVAELGRGQVK